MPEDRLVLSARLVFPIEKPPIEHGAIEVVGGRIASVGRAADLRPDHDLGNVAILPGFVNAHTHLELPPFDAPVSTGLGVEDEIAWLARLVARRRATGDANAEAVIAANLREAIAAGTTVLADITTAGRSWDQVSAAPVRAVVYAELLGLRRERGLQTSQQAWDWLAAVQRQDLAALTARPGLSPHAPYSTAGWLYERAALAQLPLTTHLAELPEELELLACRSGPLRRYLEDLGAWDEGWEPLGPTPAEYVRKGVLRKADWLIAHGTHLDPADFWRLRQEAAPDGHRVAVAYCPRTHARFRTTPHPCRALLERGVVVAIGTDSRASAPSLSVLDELRFLHRSDPSLSGPLLLTMATLFGAWALRADADCGSLVPGKSADLAVVGLPDREGQDPHNLVLDADAPVLATMFRGQFVHGPWSV